MKVLSGSECILESRETGGNQQFCDVEAVSGVCVEVEPPEDVEHLCTFLEDDRKEGLLGPLQAALFDGVDAFCALTKGSQLDLLEVCAPWDSPLCAAVRNAGGHAMSIGIHNGYDLSTPQGYKNALALIRELRPRYAHFSPPCDPWTAMQNCNQKTELQQETLRFKRQQSKKIIQNCRKLLEVQIHELQNQAGGEHPLHAQSWRHTDMRVMARMCGGRFVVHGCRHGLVSKTKGVLLKKPWGWFSTLDEMKHVLALTCNHGPKAHPVIQGADTAATAVYPTLLCNRFAKVLMNFKKGMFSIFANGHFGCNNCQQGVFVGSDFDENFPEADEADVGGNDHFDQDIVPTSPEQENPDGDLENQMDDRALDGANQETPDDTEDDSSDPEIKKLLRIVHRNLGHPSNEALRKLLRDAGASVEVLKELDRFSCRECLKRGRKTPSRVACIPKVYEKWQCVSVDTFWWKTPKESLSVGDKPEYVLGLSMMDEATDYHTAILMKTSKDPIRNIAGDDFIKAFSKGWLQTLPAPSLFRYDEEGFMRSLEVVSWLETFGMKLEPIAGESAWQDGKHSRHLQVLKENMNRLSMELGPEYRAEELLALAISAKNNMHNIRGYSPNQWAFGQNHNRISSFLQQYQNLSLQGSRDIPTFEEQVQLEEKAQRLFLQVDSRRRISRAMHAKMRPLKEFVVGDLVYYFRKGVKEGSRYGGHWHGPARVLSHEKTSDFDDSQHAGSIVWITHAGRLVRCSPEQLRHVEHDLRHVDKKINGPQNFHTMLEQISNQQKYLDLSHEDWKSVPIWGSPEEMQPHFRSRGKQSLSELRRSPVDVEIHGSQEEPGVESSVGQEGGHHGSSEVRLFPDDLDRAGRDEADGREATFRSRVSSDLPGRSVQRLDPISCGRRFPERAGDSSLRTLPSSTLGSRHPGRPGDEAIRKRKASTSVEGREREAYGDTRVPSQLHEGSGSSSSHARRRRGSGIVEPSGRSGREHDHDESERPADGTTHAADRTDHDAGSGLPATAAEPRSERRMRSRSPPNLHRNESFLVIPESSLGSSTQGLSDFVSYVDNLNVIELELNLAPRDVHKEKGCWVVNAKAKKTAEVCMRKLNHDDQDLFHQAMKKEVDSFLSADAVQICSSHGIPPRKNHADAMGAYLETSCWGWWFG